MFAALDKTTVVAAKDIEAKNLALITNMPSGHLMYAIPSGDLDFQLENGERYRGSVLEAGKTLEVSFDLEVRKE